jgi:hypothetical protein
MEWDQSKSEWVIHEAPAEDEVVTPGQLMNKDMEKMAWTPEEIS